MSLELLYNRQDAGRHGKMDPEIFKNCSRFTDEELTALALVGGISSAVCCSVLSVVLVALVILTKF